MVYNLLKMSGDDREMHNEESDQQLNRIRASRIQELNKLDQVGYPAVYVTA